MAYVYADMDALAAYQHQLVQTVPLLEKQSTCKEELIEHTEMVIRIALEQAEEAEREALMALQGAQVRLQEAVRRAAEYNLHLPEGGTPAVVPSFYYDEVDEKRTEYTYAENVRSRIENMRDDFKAYVCAYRQKQKDGIEYFKELLGMSGQFFADYLKKLVEAKKCTAGEARAFSERRGTAGDERGSSDVSAYAVSNVRNAGKQWSDSLRKEQSAAINAYTGSAYADINATLRGLNATFQEGNRDRAILIHQALAVSSIPQRCTVYRGASKAALGALQNASDEQLAGAFFSDKGFMSTSINREDSFGGEIQMVIDVPAGARGAYVGYISQLGHSESEVLFDAGQILEITKVNRDSYGNRIIHLKILI